MRKLLRLKLLSFLLLLSGTWAYGQWQNGLWIGKQAYNWHFGNFSGLNFNTTPPTPLPTTVSLYEGMGSMSDAEGNLLFFTNSMSIWNANEEIMENGDNLAGDDDPAQSGLIVPAPSQPGKYYVFHQYDFWQGILGLHYSEVDMSLDGGLGAVTANKNILVTAPNTEKLTAVHHADGEQVWVISFNGSFVNPTNDYLAFLVTPEGVNTTPVISSVGQVENFYGFGQLKASPDGTKLAYISGIGGGYLCQLFDFNNETGEVSNPRDFSSLISTWGFGIEFSPNGKYLYLIDTSLDDNPTYVYQLDLTASDEAAILASTTVIHESTDLHYAGLQLTPEGKILVSSQSLSELYDSLSIINYPNNPGFATGFESEVFGPNEGPVNVNAAGLPTFIQSYFESGILYEQDGKCPGSSVIFSTLRIPGITSIEWDFGDPDSGEDNLSSELEPTHTFNNSGTFIVTATITSNGAQQTATTEVIISPVPEVTIPSVEVLRECDNGSGTAEFDLYGLTPFILNGQSLEQYSVIYYATEEDLMSDNPIPNPQNFLTSGQEIFTLITNNISGCKSILSFNLEVAPLPLAVSPGSISKCGDETGTAGFNLTALNTHILAGQDTEDFSISYHASVGDAESGIAISVPENFSSSGQAVYAKVIDNLTDCYSIVSFDLISEETPSLASSLDYEGCPPFNLESIVNDFVTGLTLSFYASYDNAVNAVEPINSTEDYGVSEETLVYVRAENDKGCFIVSELKLKMADCSIPKGISPNNDGLNDELDLTGYNITKLSIYNRYGLTVYTQSNYTNQWRGQDNNGGELVSGTYYYVAESGDRTLTGWIYINR